MKLTIGQFLSAMNIIESRNYAGFENRKTKWSFEGNGIRIGKTVYPLKKVLKTKSLSFTTKDLEDMIEKAESLISEAKEREVMGVEFTYDGIKFLYQDDLTAGVMNYYTFLALWIAKYGSRDDNPFMDFWNGRATVPISKTGLNYLIPELEKTGYKRLARVKVTYKEETEYECLYANKKGSVVFFSEKEGEIDIKKGSIFISSSSNEFLFQSLFEYEGGCGQYRKNLRTAFTKLLTIGYEIKTGDWLYGISDESLVTFSIYANSKLFEYLGGELREEKGGEGKYLMTDDIYSSYELSMLCSFLETKYILDTVADKDFYVNRKKLDKEFKKMEANLKEQWGNHGMNIWAKCKAIIDEGYGQK